MNDTPRTDARVKQMIDNGQSPDGLEYWARDLERELNAANAEIEEKHKDVVWLATEKAKLENYVMLLEEAGDALSETQTYDLIQNINWRKAKEAKP